MPDPRFQWLYPQPPNLDAAIDRLKAEVLELPDPEPARVELDRLLQIRAQAQLITDLERKRVQRGIDTSGDVEAAWAVLESLGVQRNVR
jgi:hypothetical protein